jgi:hypothetical protein
MWQQILFFEEKFFFVGTFISRFYAFSCLGQKRRGGGRGRGGEGGGGKIN